MHHMCYFVILFYKMHKKLNNKMRIGETERDAAKFMINKSNKGYIEEFSGIFQVGCTYSATDEHHKDGFKVCLTKDVLITSTTYVPYVVKYEIEFDRDSITISNDEPFVLYAKSITITKIIPVNSNNAADKAKPII
jgi:hypothetical protein